jgi:hypothetical protein
VGLSDSNTALLEKLDAYLVNKLNQVS